MLTNSCPTCMSAQPSGGHGRLCSMSQIPERSGLPSGVRGAGAVRFGFPSGIRGTPAVGYFSHCADMQVGQEFVNIGWSLKGGLPYQPWAAAARKARMDENGKDDPSTHCLPRGVVKSHTSPLLTKIVQVPGLVIVLQEANAAYRQ